MRGQINVDLAQPEMLVRPVLADNLQFDAVDDGYILSQIGSDWAHYLNATAMLVVLQCDGSNTPDQIARFIQELHGLATPPTAEVEGVIAQLHAQSILRDAVESTADAAAARCKHGGQTGGATDVQPR